LYQSNSALTRLVFHVVLRLQCRPPC
jgi:hypothetical protein